MVLPYIEVFLAHFQRNPFTFLNKMIIKTEKILTRSIQMKDKGVKQHLKNYKLRKRYMNRLIAS